MPQPEGYRKALRLMKLAEKFGLPILTFIDTPGAYPGIGAEERGQSEAIAATCREMAGLRVPDRRRRHRRGRLRRRAGASASATSSLMLRALDLLGDLARGLRVDPLESRAEYASEAAESLGSPPRGSSSCGLVDEVVPEPLGGAHRDPPAMMIALKKALTDALRQVSEPTIDTLVEAREDRILAYGKYKEIAPGSSATRPPSPRRSSARSPRWPAGGWASRCPADATRSRCCPPAPRSRRRTRSP